MEQVTLKEYIERVISEHEQRNLDRIRSLERQVVELERLIEAKQLALALAVEKQEAAYDIRFAGVNEFRASLNDALNRSVTREFVDTKMAELERRLGMTENRLSSIDGRILGYSAGVGFVVLVIALVSQLINWGG